MKVKNIFFIIIAVCFLYLPSCSIRTLAINLVADALTGEGSSSVFTGDNDPQLVGDAIPFAIKMYEALLSQTPTHQGLINMTGSMFVMYANAFIQGPAEMLPQIQYLERQAAMDRAKKMYLRGLELLYRGLELKYPGFMGAFKKETLPQILAKTKKEDIPALYWSAAAGLSAFSLNPFDLDLGVRIMEFYSLVERAYELDPDYNQGALDDFFLLFHSSVPDGMGSDKSKVDIHFQRALEKSSYLSAGPYVSYASAVCIPAQNYDKFKEMLNKALEVDIEANPSNRLVNIISQRKARYLLDSASGLFVFFDSGDSWDDWDDNDW
ncbi:MAG: TRAP transporter TatT component family protein [Treponema sp.]|nr:TRAP transporter TatT component family protein [Treponema sp.]